VILGGVRYEQGTPVRYRGTSLIRSRRRLCKVEASEEGREAPERCRGVVPAARTRLRLRPTGVQVSKADRLVYRVRARMSGSYMCVSCAGPYVRLKGVCIV